LTPRDDGGARKGSWHGRAAGKGGGGVAS
jgi:hypothetical protein